MIPIKVQTFANSTEFKMSLILSIALFPPVDYMALLLHHPVVLIEAHESYVKQSYRNRYHVAGPNGLQVLSVPVDKSGQLHCSIQEALLAPGNWPVVHLRSLDAAYNNSPWYLYFRPEIEEMFMNLPATLWEFNLRALRLCCGMLGYRNRQPKITDSWVSHPDHTLDLRHDFHPKRSSLPFADIPTADPYKQVFDQKHSFLQGLSILDLVFNEGPSAQSYIAERYRQMQPQLP
jgi:hypothetical protein